MISSFCMELDIGSYRISPLVGSDIVEAFVVVEREDCGSLSFDLLSGSGVALKDGVDITDLHGVEAVDLSFAQSKKHLAGDLQLGLLSLEHTVNQDAVDLTVHSGKTDGRSVFDPVSHAAERFHVNIDRGNAAFPMFIDKLGADEEE